MGRNKFSESEIKTIAKLLRRKNSGTRFQQKTIRHKLRVDYEFNISDFNIQGKAFGEEDLYAAVDRGAITILDDATIAAMKVKRARDKERDSRRQMQNTGNTADQTSNWQDALAEWESWEKEQEKKEQ